MSSKATAEYIGTRRRTYAQVDTFALGGTTRPATSSGYSTARPFKTSW